MELEINEVPPVDPTVLRLVEAGRDEIETRGADNGAPRPANRLADALKVDCDTLVAYVGSVAVGTAALRELRPGIAEIKRMYVIPEHRGAGIGGKLLEELEIRARRRGFQVIRLDTHGRLGEANRMYQGAGYRRIDDYNSNPRSNRWYEKSLA
jgi:GNAT superfamily N-acetyltransferase